MIKVIGLGVTDGDLSIRGAVAIDEADTIIVKTALTPTYAFFSEYNHITCDSIYESSDNFADLDTNIASLILSHKDNNTVYCVDGSGYDDRSVILLKQLYPQLAFLPSVSRDSTALDSMPSVSYMTISACDLTEGNKLNYDSDYPLIVKDIDNAFLAASVKEVLSAIVGEELQVTFTHQGVATTMPLYKLDHLTTFDYSSILSVPPQKLTQKEVYNYADLMRIMEILRGDNGCHWDKEQDHMSIRSNAIEEAYELVEAINNDDIENIIEEAGDVILQGVFHTIIGEQEGEFMGHEVLTTLCHKLINRHTHIFGGVVANNADEALKAWETAKAKEKTTTSPTSKMSAIARSLPSLMRADKVLKIAIKSSMEFKTSEDSWRKVFDALRTYVMAEDKEYTGGDLLFCVVNMLRYNGIRAEVALSRTVDKFMNRFNFIESRWVTSEMSDIQLEMLWDEAKKNEN